MKWALSNGERIIASPKREAQCPICREIVISKCGSINVWHWSHKSLRDCDDWAEPESQWHIDWKNFLNKFNIKKEEKKDGDIQTIIR